VGLRDVLRGKRKLTVTEANGEPWKPPRHQGEDTVELSALLDGAQPGARPAARAGDAEASVDGEADELGPERPTEHA
jgi:hypothetical protein